MFHQIETAHLDECLLRANPARAFHSSLDAILDEFARFKAVSIGQSDERVPSTWIAQKLFAAPKARAAAPAVTLEPAVGPVSARSELNDLERKRLLESIRRTSCHVALVDILAPKDNKRNQTQEEKSARSKKKKRRRVRVHSDSSSNSDQSGSDQSESR